LKKTNNKKDRGKTDYFTALIFTADAHYKQLIFKIIKYPLPLPEGDTRNSYPPQILPKSGGRVQMSNSQIENQSLKVEQKFAKIVGKKSIKEKTKQKYNWSITINFVPFENDSDRQKSYELWVESFFHPSN